MLNRRPSGIFWRDELRQCVNRGRSCLCRCFRRGSSKTAIWRRLAHKNWSPLGDYTGVIGFFLHSFPPVEFASAIHHALAERNAKTRRPLAKFFGPNQARTVPLRFGNRRQTICLPRTMPLL